jgi:hypothetical protein
MSLHTFTIGTYNSSLNILSIAKTICHENYPKNPVFMVKEISKLKYYHVHILYYFTENIIEFHRIEMKDVIITKSQQVNNPQHLIQYMFKSNPRIEDIFFNEELREYQLIHKGNTYFFEPFYQPLILYEIILLDIYHPIIEHLIDCNIDKLVYCCPVISLSVLKIIQCNYPLLYILYKNATRHIDQCTTYKLEHVDVDENNSYDYLYKDINHPILPNITHKNSFIIQEPAIF